MLTCLIDTLMVHFHSANLSGAWIGRKEYLLAKHVTDALDLVDARNWHAHRRKQWARGNFMDLVQHVMQRVHMELLSVHTGFHALPPSHVLRFLRQIVTDRTRSGNYGVFFAMKSKLSLILPEMGSTGVFLAMQTFFHSTLINMLLISLEISS